MPLLLYDAFISTDEVGIKVKEYILQLDGIVECSTTFISIKCISISGNLCTLEALLGKLKGNWGTATYSPFEYKWKVLTKQLEPVVQYNVSKISVDANFFITYYLVTGLTCGFFSGCNYKTNYV